jgi:hypothetical protein
MTAADTLIARLDKVKSTGPSAWVACCPAHEDKKPSLSIRGLDDRVLVHCWAGCGAADVVAAVGLSLADLFERDDSKTICDLHVRRRPPLPSTRELLALLEYDLAAIDIACNHWKRGDVLNGADSETVINSIADVRRILDVCHAYG